METITTRLSPYFEPGLYPLFVVNNEHHGRTNLHKHEFYELVFIDHGVALHSHEGRTEILTAGDIFIILPGEVHSYISTNNTNLYNCLFTEGALRGLEGELRGIGALEWVQSDAHQGRLERIHAGVAERQEIVLKLGQLIWERLNRQVGWELKCKALLMELLVIYARMSNNSILGNSEANASYRQIMKALDYIENHYNQELPVEDIAREAGLSVGYLSKQFKGLLGTSPSEYARNFRIAKAAELLRRDDMTVAGVARELGFGDITLFSRQFRQVTGISPTGFRRNK